MDIWSGGAGQDYDMLRVFESPTYFSAKNGKINARVKNCVFGYQEEYERLQVMGS